MGGRRGGKCLRFVLAEGAASKDSVFTWGLSEAYEDQGKAVRTELHSDVVAWSMEWYLVQ